MNKEDWEVKKLGEVFELYQPKTISASDMIEDGKYPVFGANGIIGNYNQYNHKDIELLLTCRGATCGTINISQPFSWINGNAMVIHPKNADSMIFKFVYYQLLGADLSSVITGAAQPQITRKSLKVLDFHIPPLHIQTQIVAELDELNAILDKKKKQLEELDILAQATFYDMFGDPVLNDKGWEKIKLENLGQWASGGTPSRKINSYFRGDIPWVISGELNTPYIYETNEHITNEAISNSNAKLIPVGSLLLGMYDTAALKSSITLVEMSCNQAIAYAKLDDQLCDTIYVYHSIQINKEEYKKQQRGIRQKNLNLSMIKSISILYPPLSLQHQFAERIEAIEAQKELINQSIKEVQLLFDYTMDKYFN